MALSGGKVMPLPLPRGPDESQSFMAWGKQGELWFSVTDRNGRAHLRILPADGSAGSESFSGLQGETLAALAPDFSQAALYQDDGTGPPRIARINLATRARTPLRWPSPAPRRIQQPVFFEDNRALNFLADPGREHLAVYQWPLGNDGPRLLAERDEDIVQTGSAGATEWVVEYNSGRPVLSLSAGYAGIPLKLAPASGGFSPLRVSKTGDKALLRAEGEGQPGDIWLYTDSEHEPLRLTDLRNPAISSRCEVNAIAVAPDPADPALTGWLYEPKKIQAGVILLPEAPGPGFRPQFDGRINYFVSRGFLVLALNRRGTDCCGASWAFADGFASDAGLQEIAAARKYLQAAGVPENRVVLWGEGSGGTLALRALQNTPNDYAAGVITGAPVDLAAWRAGLPEGALRGRLVAALGENGAARKRSPLHGSFAQAPPLIILHGADDEIVPVSQAEALVEVLLGSGRTVAFHVYEGANHELDRPSDRANALSSVGKFLRRHVLMKAAPKK